MTNSDTPHRRRLDGPDGRRLQREGRLQPESAGAINGIRSAAGGDLHEQRRAVRGERSVSAQPPGTCVPATGYIRCWHFQPTLVLWVSPNARWARGGTPFVHYLRSVRQGTLQQDDRVVWRPPSLPRQPDAPGDDRRGEVYLLMSMWSNAMKPMSGK